MEKPLTPQLQLHQTIKEQDICYPNTTAKRDLKDDDSHYFESVRKIHVKNWHLYEDQELIQRQMHVNQKMLLRIQLALDDILYFLKNQRGKKDESFSAIRKNMINDRLFMELRQFRQILFLKPDFYVLNWKINASNRFELFVSLPEEYDLEKRKRQFKKSLTEFYKKNKRIQIPEFQITKDLQLLKQKEEQEKNNPLVRKIWKRQDGLKKLNPKDALTNPNYFEQVLLKSVREKQIMLQKRNEENKKIIFNPEDEEAVFDQIYKIYQAKQISCFFELQLLLNLKKNLKKMKDQLIEAILNSFVEKLDKYFQVQEHSQGKMIKINKTLYNETRKKLNQK